ncbi:hypothetical protein Psed_0012 [Pseudonocardia dioxanivorans CB1190]|uniref:Uncharacterized protein n=1 Tax=Pseudonocardia dioxanivorans (strain ATCC 55486 / DSM 44775 / JCM 13855 / CB1190) TaxID=675635 RepID=F4CK74_PSEUX|nr:hypothetical protein Psed_0012 [Pseudonocardia dioxanivorans CB1190]
MVTAATYSAVAATLEEVLVTGTWSERAANEEGQQ